ncbi:YopX family protein [Bacillus wiedmannii]|uniref:YopX family protein n=1 Tax=Bacillus wiedmannii TaxID=1890302 RepID=UPI000BF73C64|nr:YopX family protein [Bacillus wiedmannii]PGC72659.1 hypothetical protein COM25_23000 [Bacillus wiedmannii]
MREIKFRGMPIEDYGDTKWFYGNAIVNYDDKLAYIEASGQGFVPVKWETVSQYTGLSDKNGEEIYEGDILEFSGNVVALGIVKYNENFATFQACNGNSGWLFGNESGTNIEILGNIYENPELLKGAAKE